MEELWQKSKLEKICIRSKKVQRFTPDNYYSRFSNILRLDYKTAPLFLSN